MQLSGYHLGRGVIQIENHEIGIFSQYFIKFFKAIQKLYINWLNGND